MELGKLLTEGKGKRVYATDDPDQAIVYFKDEAMAFHNKPPEAHRKAPFPA